MPKKVSRQQRSSFPALEGTLPAYTNLSFSFSQIPGLDQLPSSGQCMGLGNYHKHFVGFVRFSEVNGNIDAS